MKNTFAIVEIGGKQYKVSEGDTLKLEKLVKPAKGGFTFDKVLLFDDGEKTIVGAPYLSGKKVAAEFVTEGRDKKIRIIKFKNKTRSLKRQGHRQWFTKVKITSIA